MTDFNCHMLVLAREARGLTQAQVSRGASLAQGTLSKIETGIKHPSDSAVSALSAALDYPESFFFEPGRPYGFPPFHYRKRKKLSAKKLGRIVAEMNIRRIHVAKLAISFPVESSIPELDPDEYQGRSRKAPTIEALARSARELWMLHSGPVPNMIELIEDRGGMVVPCDFGSTDIDAMSQRIDGMPVLFFINSNAPSDRVRYTLAHELGHMCLHTTTPKEDKEMESEADSFAGAFLMPADEIKPQLRRFDLRQVANLKRYWKVSMAAIAYRANDLGLLTPYQYKSFWMEMGKLGYRKREPVEVPKETPTLLSRMIDFHREKLGYSTKDLAALLCQNEAEFREMYDEREDTAPDRESPHLRVVR